MYETLLIWMLTNSPALEPYNPHAQLVAADLAKFGCEIVARTPATMLGGWIWFVECKRGKEQAEFICHGDPFQDVNPQACGNAKRR